MTCILRPPRPGDIGWIIHRQAVLYALEYQLDQRFEGLVAQVAGAFAISHDPDRERCWIAERNGVIVGSVFIVSGADEVANLRLLYVDPSARGLGIGRRLIAECVEFAQQARYRCITLWTTSNLSAARRIYEAADFYLVDEQPHDKFGRPLIGQTWALDL